ncbi:MULTISPECIES: tyrosine-type recombinase/integrase [Pseudomonas]|uniref:tyrosine-type recombinase/integrase n=1 Tax=Pseudomonas TaxID=286 RepID=UPI001BCD5C1B|nr:MULTISPECIES: tyrosine-type recombinase/integrase [Pseudomonas]MBS7600495.1 tyrosine-type recombinase/integrase [Pseudomonas sp. RC2C2]UVL26254.1 tyrosine-type recombinase/integrase [Pseudomonas donghuensis]
MRLKKPRNRDLPPRMLRRVRKLKSGKQWVGYYYDGRDANGKRVEIPLGTDLDVAKIEWAKLDRKAVPKITRLLGDVFNRYERDVIPGKMPRTQKDNLLCLKQLRAAFADAPIDAITPQIIAQYRDKRSGKVRANREISLLSHIYNMAREWGITERENPAAGIRKNRERPRDFYAGPEIWNAVYECAVDELRDAMDLAYLTGQRPADVLSMRARDCDEGYLQVAQRKTSKKLRIALCSEGKRNDLGALIFKLLRQRYERGVRNPYLINTPDGRNVTASMLRLRFDDARKAAIANAMEAHDGALAEQIRNFQFRDIRPKAASEIDDLNQASRLLGHTDKRITETVYRRVGEIVNPTR